MQTGTDHSKVACLHLHGTDLQVGLIRHDWNQIQHVCSSSLICVNKHVRASLAFPFKA